MATRISLTEASRRAPRMLERGDSQLLDEGAAPTLSDLAGALQFALGDGRIWLNDARMVLMQTHVLGNLRKGMIDRFGLDRTRDLFMQIGWSQGVQSANLITKRFKQDNTTAALAAGPRIHTMEGFAKVTTKRFEFDATRQTYLGEFYWNDSTEGAEHVRHFGICDCPVCWMQVAYPSGYTSTLLGFPVIFREIECLGQGAERCIVVGKDAESWGDDVPELAQFGLTQAPRRKSAPWKPPVDLTELPKPADRHEIVGSSHAVLRARRLLEKVAVYAEPVLLLGETGTGKEHFARHLHKIGGAPGGPFITVSCAVFESEPQPGETGLFGPGGLIEQATGGTLFLNDVLALPRNLQARLALMLPGKRGDSLPFRVISATGQQPLDAVMAGTLRADLHYFLSVLPIQIPPLRDRRDDLPALIDHFLELHVKHHKKPLRGLTGSLTDLLLRYDFPGNLRELSNMIERGVVYAEPGGLIDISHVFTGIENPPPLSGRVTRDGGIYRPKSMSEVRGDRTLAEIETEALLSALDDCGWNIAAAARKLGLTRAKLDYRIQKLNLKRE